ncbi:hypothetical protein PSI9734_00008 [Pseudidiomarina piscicola]|uniref:Type 4 fimbrial biogenesis protein PilX N-terminal domain-containing protein n=1 Tax=Pseudidiomarina piscicola TaxID=2614830 RepID=A0A6S6WIY8_9GAMM|nr:pilus assembly PilX N-terminal domain-containing protein [Pseudidiomarina piscicola]CAB0149445.1 hypothetical protein PSI9734_00008 [Pseudidiomarina piscicola]VZT38887.1 hypothetical protein PSI9734_00008 [Pseudomonas aeruginosa]
MRFSQRTTNSGFATVTLTVLLLAIIILVTLYTAKFKAQEQRIMRNHMAMMEARTVADAALEQTIMEIDKDRNNLDRTITGTIDGANYTATLTSTNYVGTARGSVDIVDVQVVANSADGSATQRAAIELMVSSLIRSGPTIPLAIRGGVNVSGSFQIVANANGGGDGVPLSIWSKDDVDINGNGTTCGQWEFENGVCSSQTLSERGDHGIDILDADPNFPGDLLDYLFGIPEDNWEDLRAMANYEFDNCNSLGPTTTGLIWINGDCDTPNGDIGTPTEPALIVVHDGDFKMNGNVTLYGMIFQFVTPGQASPPQYSITLNGGAFVEGSILASQSPKLSNGNLTIRYNSDVLERIETNDEFRRVHRVGGSWHDF